MSLQLSAAPCHHNKKLHYRKPSSFRVSASLDLGVKSFTAAKSASLMFEAARERIVKLIHKPEVSVSTYDTAWVAMVASPHSSVEPCFPDCVSWLAENQCPDGSWSRSHHHSLLQKDVISSTMACVLALKKWGVGEDQINRGVRFIEMNFASTNEKKQISPIGFDIIFPSMLDYARDLSLNLNLEPTAMNALFHKRNLELKRCYETKSGEMEAYMAYISEGMGKLHDWNSVMKYQRRNGSLFNSPSTTAAACIFHHNERCIDFLRTALKKFGNAVPALYPQSLYNQLCTVHNLEKLGISQYFRIEIQSVLDEAYRWWLQDEEETITDASMCALAFKILRNNGYDLNSDQMTRALEGDFLGGGMTGISRTLELYQASEIIFPFETALEKQNLRLKHSLELELSDPIHSNKLDRDIIEEVKHALEYPFYAITPRMVERRNIEKYKPENIRMLKTSVCSPNFGNSDFHYLSVMDFNRCQQVHLEELKELERWVLDNRLDELKFARQKSAYAFFSAASTFFSPDLSEARMAWAKSCVLTTILDDFFDFGGSLEELKNLVQLVELWDVNASTECISHNVATLFSAVKTIICDIGDKASIQQERSVTKHIVNIWIEMFNSMLREATWTSDSSKPTMEEYLTCADISFALGPIVLPTLYLVGPKISEEMVQHPEYSYLFNLMSISGRLVNDIQTYEREMKQSKLNAVPLYMINCGGDVTEEAAIVEIKRMIERKRRELHKLVIAKNTVLPRACKELFWHMSTIVHLFYIKDDGYSSEDFIHVAKNFIYEPIVVPDQL